MAAMRRTTCSACGNAGLDLFLDLGSTPIADAYTANENDPVDKYPLELAVCNKCYLVQLLEVVPHKVLFGTGYSFYTSASPPLSRYHERYADNVLLKHRSLAQQFTLEIGCNDGDLLRHFAAAGCRTLGIDPAIGPVEVARERGLDVRIRPFDLKFATHLMQTYEQFPLVIANHVLAHVADVSDMLAGISFVLASNGVAIIEVQYLPDLLVNNAFDLVYHEHRNFFSLTSLENAANRHGLFVADAELTDRQGGSLRVTFTKANKPIGPHIDLLDSERWLYDYSAYAGMQGRAERIRSRLRDLIANQMGTVAVYGAPAKATTLLNFCGLTHIDLKWCEDSTLAKQGRYIPGTGIPIIKPIPTADPSQHPRPDAYLLASWNYAGAIMAANPGNRWIVPIPAPVVL